MKPASQSETLFIYEMAKLAHALKVASGGLGIGQFIRSIRKQLGLSQQALAKRAQVPQSTISRLENGQNDVNITTLIKVLSAMSCDLLMVPVLQMSIEDIKRAQAKKIAAKRIAYLKGTMSLENQEPDPHFMEQLRKKEEDVLLKGSSARLWKE